MTSNGGNGGRISKRRAVAYLIAVVLVLGAGLFYFGVTAQEGNDPYNVTPTTTYDAADGPMVHIAEDIRNTTVRQPFPSPNRIDIYLDAYVRSDGPTVVRLEGIQDEWTNASQLDVGEHELTLAMSDKSRLNVSGDAGYVEFRDPVLDDGSVDARYAASGASTVTWHRLTAGDDVAAWDADTGERLDWNTTDSDGRLMLHLPQSDREVELRTANEPAFDDSTAEPTGPQSDYPEELAVNVTHEDFPSATLSVEFTLNGDVIGTDVLEDAGRVSVDAPDHIPGGTNSWNATATDDYGNVVESADYEFDVPSELEIRDEENPSELVTEANATLEFYFSNGNEEIIERDASDGTIDMAGLPTDQSFVAVASADGYHPRRVFVTSLFESQQIYLLNESSEYTDVTFELQDFTGDFPESDTVLIVERNIDGQWDTVQGDFFGATGEWTAQLAFNTRHRLILLNTETGQERPVGTFTPVSSSVQTIRVLRSDVTLEDVGPQVSVEPQTRTLPASENTSVRVDVDANDVPLDYWTVTVTYTDESGTETLHTETIDGPEGGEVAAHMNLSDRDGGTVAVEVDVVTDGGDELSQRTTYRVAEYYEHSGSLWAVLGDVGGVLGIGAGGLALLAAIVTVLVTTTVAAFARVSTEIVGATAVACVAVFSVVGWMPRGALVAAAVAYVGLWAVRRGI